MMGTLGVKVRAMRQSRVGNVVVTFGSKEEKQVAKAGIKEYRVIDEDDRKVPLAIRGVRQADVGLEELKEGNEVLGKNWEKIEWEWVNGTLKMETDKETARELLSAGRVYSEREFQSYRITIWAPTPKHCRRCYRFGHLERACQGRPRCERCGGGHQEKDCERRDEGCVWCVDTLRHSSHRPRLRECSTWADERKRAAEDLEEQIWKA